METVNVFWFRRDLRLDDNHGLHEALSEGLPVVPVFIFDPGILTQFPDPNDARITFIHRALVSINYAFGKYHSSLQVYFSSPEVVFKQLAGKYFIRGVYMNEDYEPEAIQRDQKVEKILHELGIRLYSFKDQVIFHREEVVKSNGEPYTVFTPYSHRWKDLLAKEPVRFFESERLLTNLKPLVTDYFPELNELGYLPQKIVFPSSEFNVPVIENYAHTRDFPAENGTTRLGIHLRFGTVSIRKLVMVAQQYSSIFLNELIWREFYMNILWHFPHVAKSAFKPAYDHIPWRNNEEEFNRWCNGQTGFPLVDAGMREMNQTGYMHNRVRMVVASFLTKHLLIDWRWGEAYFAEKLHDYELASNNGGWQWASGSGCDAAPYFRIFNPQLQARKFDHDHRYILKWVPEYATHSYAHPMVDHAAARIRAIETYRKALSPLPV